MNDVPRIIDGATVLQVADLSRASQTGRTRHVVGGKEMTAFAALALAHYDSDPGIYLLYCDETWRAITDTYHESVDQAVAQAEFEFGPLDFQPVEPL
jgi:hypothetical protein